MKRLLIILVLLAGTAWGASSACTQAVKQWSATYKLDRALIWAIILNESRGRWWVSSDDRAVLTNCSWAWSVVRRFRLDPARADIWKSYGVMQVSYLVALDLGYRGGPEGLRDSRTNVKYGCMRLEQIRRGHGGGLHLENWIWHYNQSLRYVADVLSTYRKLGGRLR